MTERTQSTRDYLKSAFKRNVLSKKGVLDILKRLVLSILVLSPIALYLGVRFLMVQTSPANKGPWVIWAHERLNPASRVEVWWETEKETGTNLWLSDTPGGTFHPVANDPTPVKIHVVLLDNLQPDTRYYYKLKSDSTTSRSFRTAPNTAVPFNFTMYSDTQAMWGTGHMPRVAQAIGRIQDTAFVANIGDLVQDGDYKPYWDYFFRTNDYWMKKFGFVPVPGNHDERGGFNESSWYPRYFNFSNDDRRLFYAFNWSNVLFVSLQIAVGGDANANEDGGIQRAWLEDVLGASQDKAFRVVFFHRQVYSSISEGDSGSFIETWLPTMNEYNVSLVIHGHHHSYQRFWDGNRTYLCLAGGGGMLDLAHGTRPGLQAVNPIPNYLVGRVDGNQMRLTTYTPGGEVVDDVTIENNPVTHQAVQVPPATTTIGGATM